MATPFKYSGERKSFQSLNAPYFWTSVIKDWKHLLKDNVMKMIIIQSFQWLTQKELINIFGYVIMPNHIHVLWEQLKMNGKETPKASFEKYTGHMFLKQLRADNKNLDDYISEQNDRNYLFWQRDPLAIQITNRQIASNKLDYLHYNPLQPHWQLCNDHVEYKYSSAKFYETGEDDFKILTHYMDHL
jgi:putative transposase